MADDYMFEGYLVRIEDGVPEQFSQAIAGSYRVPLVWASAQFEQRKHDVVRVQIGVAADLQASFFSSVAFTNPAFTMDLPAAEEPRLRAFLEAAARTAARST